MNILVYGIFGFYLFISVLSQRNNVCRTMKGYWFKTDNCWYDPDLYSTTFEIVVRYGYPIQPHFITTADGYILQTVRIPHNGKDINKKRQPVFLQHGMLLNSDIWVGSKNRSLAFVLSNLGYDVWMGNTRGSSYSSQHLEYTIDDKEYWSYTLDDLGHYDMPAVLDYIEKETKQKIIYIGHSQGGTQGFIYAIDNQTSAEKNLKALVLLAPAAYMNDLPVIGPLNRYLDALANAMIRSRIYKIGGGKQNEIKLLIPLCLQTPIQLTFCKYLLEVIHGSDSGNQWSPDLLPAVITNMIDRQSVLSVQQFFQFMDSHNFQSYDFGEKRNLEKYGQKMPRIYDLGKVNIPVYLFYGRKDYLVYYTNILRVYDELRSPKKIFEIGGTKYAFNHVHFMYSNKIEEELYSKLLPIVDEARRL